HPRNLEPPRRDEVARLRVRNDDRPSRLDDPGMQRRIRGQRADQLAKLLPALRIRPAVGVLGHEGHYPPRDPALDRAAVYPADLGDLDRHLAQQPSGVEGRVEDLGPLEQRAALLEPAARLAIQARVADRDARLGHEALEELAVVLAEVDRP